MLNYYRAALRGGGALRQRRLSYPIIEIPTLVLWGLRDHALGPHNLDELNRFVSDLTVVTLGDAGHFVHEDEPDRVNHELVTWLHKRLRDLPQFSVRSPHSFAG